MMQQDERIMALDPRARSFGFAVFDGQSRLLDWGVRSFRQGVNAVKIPAGEKIAALLDDFAPDAIVVRHRKSDGNPKRREMRDTILRAAANRGIPARLLYRGAVKDTFSGMNRNKYTIAAALAERFPALSPALPIAHKIWMSEEYSLPVFDAAAVGIASFTRGKSISPPSTHV